MAYFEGKIFIGRNSSRPITIHSDVPSYDELDAIKIDGLHRVQDLVVCTESRQLFVADWKCIWSISLGSTGYNAGAVRCIETDCRTWTMSTKNGSLVATTYDVNCLFVYKTSDTVDDLPPKRVQLPDTMFPHHAAATKYESFVISHVQYSSTDGMNMKRYTQVGFLDFN